MSSEVVETTASGCWSVRATRDNDGVTCSFEPTSRSNRGWRPLGSENGAEEGERNGGDEDNDDDNKEDDDGDDVGVFEMGASLYTRRGRSGGGGGEPITKGTTPVVPTPA